MIISEQILGCCLLVVWCSSRILLSVLALIKLTNIDELGIYLRQVRLASWEMVSIKCAPSYLRR